MEYKLEPFPHIVIYGQFTDDELVGVWRELAFLTHGKLDVAAETGSAFHRECDGKTMLKNNRAVWLDKVYTDRKYSDILCATRKIFQPSFSEAAAKIHWVFKYLPMASTCTTLLSYYEDGGYYKPHFDICTLTAVTHVFKEPRRFDGGELIFPDFDYNVGIVNNRTIIFPSAVNHEVADVKMQGGEPFSGRYTITQFLRV